MPASTHVREFTALGTYVHLQTVAEPDRAAETARELLDQVDLACSRFRSDSDLSRANAAAGRWTPVSALFLTALEVAIAVAEETDGLVDPCLGRNLVELGYDVDFDLLSHRADGPRTTTLCPVRFGAWADILIDPEGAVRVPAGVAVDLGATAKAWASDLIALSLAERTGGPVLISLGGDIRIASPEGGRREWPIVITEHPGGEDDPLEPAFVWLDDGGLATSSTRVRRWRTGGAELHHLIDPRTGVPATGPWRTVTTTGPSCVAANAASTAALVLQTEAVDWLEERNVDARLVGTDGTLTHLGHWPTTTDEPAEEQPCSRP